MSEEDDLRLDEFIPGAIVVCVQSNSHKLEVGREYTIKSYRRVEHERSISDIIYLEGLSIGFYVGRFRLAHSRSRRDLAVDAIIGLINSRARSPTRDELIAALKENGL